MNRLKTVLLGVSALAAGAVIAGGVNLATAATGDDDTSETPGYGHGHGWGRGHEHTPVTGSEKTKVSDAVTSKYSDVTVETVLKDDDGDYDVLAKQAGKPVFVKVSKDLKTVELHAPGMGERGMRGPGMPGPGMGRGGPMWGHTPVTGSERTKVVDAVTGKYKTVKVMAVLKDDDGTYDVLGTQGDSPVKVEVSKDLKTVSLEKGGPGMGMMHGRGHGGPHMWGPPPGFGPRGDDKGDDGDDKGEDRGDDEAPESPEGSPATPSSAT